MPARHAQLRRVEYLERITIYSRFPPYGVKNCGNYSSVEKNNTKNLSIRCTYSLSFSTAYFCRLSRSVLEVVCNDKYSVGSFKLFAMIKLNEICNKKVTLKTVLSFTCKFLLEKSFFLLFILLSEITCCKISNKILLEFYIIELVCFCKQISKCFDFMRTLQSIYSYLLNYLN